MMSFSFEHAWWKNYEKAHSCYVYIMLLILSVEQVTFKMQYITY